MELKLIRTKDIPGVAFLKTYEYEDFHVQVNIDEDGFVEIEASDTFKEIFIRAINDEPAVFSIENVYLSSKKSLNGFIEKIKKAGYLMDIINNERMRLIEKEENG